jgi:hypothetical protein
MEGLQRFFKEKQEPFKLETYISFWEVVDKIVGISENIKGESNNELDQYYWSDVYYYIKNHLVFVLNKLKPYMSTETLSFVKWFVDKLIESVEKRDKKLLLFTVYSNKQKLMDKMEKDFSKVFQLTS